MEVYHRAADLAIAQLRLEAPLSKRWIPQLAWLATICSYLRRSTFLEPGDMLGSSCKHHACFSMDFDSVPIKRRGFSDTLAKASGHWPHLLMALGGLNESQLNGAHQPCPCCGGNDRYRWMTDDGPGGWFCSHCGGKRQQGGGGSGIDLLMRLRNWRFSEAIQRVDQYYNGLPFQPAAKPPAPLPKKSITGSGHSELERFLLLELAGHLAIDEHYSPTEAKMRSYSKRWAVYAVSNYDAALSVVLQFETERGIVDISSELYTTNP